MCILYYIPSQIVFNNSLLLALIYKMSDEVTVAVTSDNEEEAADQEVEEEAEDAWIISVTDPTVEELDYNQARINKLQNLECLTEIQVSTCS